MGSSHKAGDGGRCEGIENDTMNALTRRIRSLEDLLGIKDTKTEAPLIVASRVGLALNGDTCVQILRECGFLPFGPDVGFVNLLSIPEDLDAEETVRFLRESGAEICYPRNA